MNGQTTSNFAYGNADQLTGNGSSSVGNTTSLWPNTFGYAVSGTYDAWGRLVSTAITGGGTQNATYRYDALGRQVSLSEVASNTAVNLTNHSELYYDGSQMIEQRNSESGSAVEQYVYSPVTGQIILRDRSISGSGSNGLDERLYPLYNPDGSVGAIASNVGTVVERYIYDGLGQVQALSPNGTSMAFSSSGSTDAQMSSYFIAPLKDMTGRLSAAVGGTSYDWTVYWHGMSVDRISGLYIGAGGQAYSPDLGRMMQPHGGDFGTSYTRNGGYSYTQDQLNGSWQSNAWDAFVSPGDYGAASQVTQPASIQWASRISGLVGASALTVATLGLGSAAAWAVGGMWAGAGAGTLIGGSISSYMGQGFNSGAGIGFNVGSILGGSLPGLFTSSGATLACRLPSAGQGSLIGAGIGGSFGGLQGFLDTRTLEGTLGGFANGALWGAAGGAIGGALNPFVCFVAGTRVVVGVEDENGGDALRQTSASRQGSTAGAAIRLRYVTQPIEQLVAAGGGECGDGGGQYVISRDQNDPDGPLTRARISRTYQRTAHALRILTLCDEEGKQQTLKVTPEHPFFDKLAGWTKAKNLAAGDILLGGQGVLNVIENVHEAHPGGVTVYNLEVVAGHTYFVRSEGWDGEPVWAHNANYLNNGVTRDFDEFMGDNPSIEDQAAWTQARAAELQAAAGKAGKFGTIMSVGIVNGRPVIGTSEGGFRASVLDNVRDSEVLVYGNQHGEVDIANLAIQEGYSLGPVASGNATGHCAACASYITANGGVTASATGVYIPRTPYTAVFSPVRFEGPLR